MQSVSPETCQSFIAVGIIVLAVHEQDALILGSANDGWDGGRQDVMSSQASIDPSRTIVNHNGSPRPRHGRTSWILGEHPSVNAVHGDRGRQCMQCTQRTQHGARSTQHALEGGMKRHEK